MESSHPLWFGALFFALGMMFAAGTAGNQSVKRPSWVFVIFAPAFTLALFVIEGSTGVGGAAGALDSVADAAPGFALRWCVGSASLWLGLKAGRSVAGVPRGE